MKLGRSRVGKAKSYRINSSDYGAFSRFCKEKNQTKSEVLRSLIIRFYTEGMVRQLTLETLRKLKEKEIVN